MVDSNDTERIEEASEELNKLLNEDELQGIPVLVFANKQDLPKALSVEEVTRKLELHKYVGRKWIVQGASANRGEGLFEGLEWLSNALTSSKVQNKRSIPRFRFPLAGAEMR